MLSHASTVLSHSVKAQSNLTALISFFLCSYNAICSPELKSREGGLFLLRKLALHAQIYGFCQHDLGGVSCEPLKVFQLQPIMGWTLRREARRWWEECVQRADQSVTSRVACGAWPQGREQGVANKPGKTWEGFIPVQRTGKTHSKYKFMTYIQCLYCYKYKLV